jgi:hypothetical protein
MQAPAGGMLPLFCHHKATLVQHYIALVPHTMITKVSSRRHIQTPWTAPYQCLFAACQC